MWSSNILPIYPLVTDSQGNVSPKPGYSVTATQDVLFDAPACASYQVVPPLNNVWAGDNPDDPQWTSELCFPDEATAQSVLSAYWVIADE